MAPVPVVLTTLAVTLAFAPSDAAPIAGSQARSSMRHGALQLALQLELPLHEQTARGNASQELIAVVPHEDSLGESMENPLQGKVIWNDTWVNFTFWHPSGTVSNLKDGKVAWANVGFMNIAQLFKLSFVAYPGALIPLALCGSVIVGMSLQVGGVGAAVLHNSDATASQPPAACPSQLAPHSQDLYAHWCMICRTLPSLLVFGVPMLLVFLSNSWPQEIFTITLITSSAFVFMNGLYMVVFAPFVLNKMHSNMKKSSRDVLNHITACEKLSVVHWVIFPNYNEDVEILAAAIGSVAKSSLAKVQIGIVLAMEEREGELGREKAKELTLQFENEFLEVAVTYHPANLPNDPPGKASNVAYAFKWLSQHVSAHGNDPSKVMLTVADADSEFHGLYFELLTQKYLEHKPEDRNNYLWQSPVLHVKNYHRQTGPVIVGTMFTAMAEIASLADPNAMRLPYSTYSLTMSLASEVGGWDATWIAEDWHMGIKCFLLTLGRTSIEPVLVPTINYTPEADTWLGTLYARFAQAKRHALGFSDLAYFFMMLPLIFAHLSSGRHPGAGLADFWRLLFNGTPYMVKIVNVHVIIGIMILYALLDVTLKQMMVLCLDHSLSMPLFDRTFFATSMFSVAAVTTTIVVCCCFQVLYRIMKEHLEKPTKGWSAFLFDNIVLHTLMTALCFALCGPIYFITLAYSVWLAAIKLLTSHTFVYEVAAKPSKESRLA